MSVPPVQGIYAAHRRRLALETGIAYGTVRSSWRMSNKTFTFSSIDFDKKYTFDDCLNQMFEASWARALKEVMRVNTERQEQAAQYALTVHGCADSSLETLAQRCLWRDFAITDQPFARTALAHSFESAGLDVSGLDSHLKLVRFLLLDDAPILFVTMPAAAPSIMRFFVKHPDGNVIPYEDVQPFSESCQGENPRHTIV